MDHPYYPLGVSIPDYRPNDLPLSRSLPIFGALLGSVVVPAYLLAGSGSGSRRRVRPIDRFAASWFALCELFLFMYALNLTRHMANCRDSENRWLLAYHLRRSVFILPWKHHLTSSHSIVSDSSHIGYYILHRTTISSKNTLFAQLWKEYALSDSRYLTSDIFTVCVETITVVSPFFYP